MGAHSPSRASEFASLEANTEVLGRVDNACYMTTYVLICFSSWNPSIALQLLLRSSVFLSMFNIYSILEILEELKTQI
ncbi:hypothetical protein O6P43_023124 [Quillaja saponaria]|uniref:Uncharacterized protein n=1 Tax=Quillaja saponaria TaxID=32244 RepID=A0AAD7PJ12_QUISA|nr:hypothetical protein O6P43_023124 [Quillaja saponaria]